MSISGVRPFPFFERQVLWMGAGFILLVAASFLDFRLFRTQRFVVLALYLVTTVLLVGVLLANGTIRGVQSWFRIGGVLVQPVEPMKVALIVLLAKFFSRRHVEIYRARHVVVSALYMVIPAGLVLLQPDVGSAILLAGIWVATIVFSGIKTRHLLFLLSLIAIASLVGWYWLLAPYQKARIITFFDDPYRDPRGAGYQMIQTMIAAGSGQFWGKGLGYGSQTHLHFLPEAETDFIFATFAEEWGFMGAMLLLALVALVIWRSVAIGMSAADNFSRLYAHGFAALIFMQSFIHIGMNLGALPITGITLPFVSYGGSSLVTSLWALGILQNIKITSRREFEEKDSSF